MEIDGKVNARTVTLRSSFNEPLSDSGSDFFFSFFAFFAPSAAIIVFPLRLCVRFLSVFVFLFLVICPYCECLRH